MFEKIRKPIFDIVSFVKFPRPRRINPRLQWIRGRVGIACMVIVLMLMIFFSYTTVSAFQKDTKTAQENVLASYQHQGEFDYRAFVGMSDDENEQATISFFQKIVESIDLSFSYEFVPDEPVTIESSDIQIDAILANPGKWQKEITLVPRTAQNPGEFTFQFPLDIPQITSHFEAIEEELGFRGKTRDLTIMARVFTSARTSSGELNDTFIVPLKIDAGVLEIELQGVSDESKRDYIDDFGYTHLGKFGYEVKLKSNSLYGTVTFESRSKPAGMRTVGPGADLLGKTVDSADFTFSYDFQSDVPAVLLSENVKVTGVLQHPGKWSETIFLVPEMEKTGGFTVNFHIDPGALEQRAREKDAQLMLAEEEHRLKIAANVQLQAQTDAGPINETFTQNLDLSLEEGVFKFEDALVKEESGSIAETVWITNAGVGKKRVLSGVGLGIMLALFEGLILGYYWAKPPKLPPADEEAKQAKRKHKDMILDVKEMPLMTVPDGLVELSALAELVRVADGMAKPVLHKVEDDNHIYLVITENAQYLYMSGERWKHFHPARRGNVFVNT